MVSDEGSCSPFVGIHIADKCFWFALGYCSLLSGHLYGQVNTAAQHLTSHHIQQHSSSSRRLNVQLDMLHAWQVFTGQYGGASCR